MKKKHGKIVMLARTKINMVEVLISNTLNNTSYISHDEFVLINGALKEHDGVKEENKNLKTSSVN